MHGILREVTRVRGYFGTLLVLLPKEVNLTVSVNSGDVKSYSWQFHSQTLSSFLLGLISSFPISPQYENYYQPRRWILKITFEKWIMLRVFECFLVSGECHAFPRGPSDSWGTPHGKNALPAVQSEIHCETIIWSIFTFSPIFSPNQLTFISRLLIFSKISCKNITPITWIARLKKRLSAS